MKTSARTSVGLPTRLAVVQLDLGVVLGVTLLADVVVTVAGPQPLRVVAAGLLLFFLPGYAVVAALYPAASGDRSATAGGGAGSNGWAGPGLLERLVLSFGVSLAAIPIAGLTMWVVGPFVAAGGPGGVWTARVTPLPVLNLLVVGGCAVASFRRLRLPEVQRFSLPYDEFRDAMSRALGPSVGRLDRLLTVVLAASILVAATSIGYAIATPVDGEQYTSTALLTVDEDGQPVANGYPSRLAPGESTPLVLKLANHEGTDQSYTVVVRAERVRTAGDTTTVLAASELDRLSVALSAGETRYVRHTVAPETTGETVRLTYYVYRGEAPTTPSRESAYRVLYLWVTVGSG